jgi:ATP-dependent 26S proteasome regulatory subunit
MPFSWFTKKPIKDDFSSAMREYQQGKAQEKRGHHRDGYIWYLRAQSSFKEMVTKYGDDLGKHYKDMVKKTLKQIDDRLPLCAGFAADEIIKVKNRLIHKHRMVQLPDYDMTQQDIITLFDEEMFIKPLTKEQKALIPDVKAMDDYTDESTDEDDTLATDPEKIAANLEKKERKLLRIAPTIKPHHTKSSDVAMEHRRPRRPRVLSKRFKRMMQQNQPWDCLKHMVYTRLLNVRWSDVIGYTSAKQLLYDTIVHEANRRTPRDGFITTKAVLLYGPPGTGKSQLADCVASEAPSNVFIKATTSDLLNKYLGQSEKNINLLFQMANALRPSIIYFDECDAVFGARKGNNDSNTNSSITANLLNLMSTYTDISIIATTNLPWNLDSAFIRRFSNHCLLDMPTEKEKEVMLRYCTRSLFLLLTELDFEALAKQLDGYSGSDIKLICTKIYQFQTHVERSARYFKFCPLRKDKLVPCFSSDKDPSVSKSHFLAFSEGDLHRPALNYHDVRSIIKHYCKRSIGEEIVDNLREYAKDPEGGDPAKKKKERPVYSQYPPPGYRPSYTGNFGSNGNS